MLQYIVLTNSVNFSGHIIQRRLEIVVGVSVFGELLSQQVDAVLGVLDQLLLRLLDGVLQVGPQPLQLVVPGPDLPVQPLHRPHPHLQLVQSLQDNIRHRSCCWRGLAGLAPGSLPLNLGGQCYQDKAGYLQLVLCSAPSVPQPVVQSRRRPLLGPSPG